MRAIDLNCDLGEGAGHDAELLTLVTSANIACGAHAGDEATMRATAELAHRHRVAIGAHPGFADRAHFGRRASPTTPDAVHALVLTQVRHLQRIARDCGAPVTHVKPHGALYNLAARDESIARAVARATRDADPRLSLFALAGSAAVTAGREAGLRVAQEAYADRTYRADGSLTPRDEPGALVPTEAALVAQVLRLVRCGTVLARDGREVPVAADTICLHGDGAHAVRYARCLRAALAEAHIRVQPWDR